MFSTQRNMQPGYNLLEIMFVLVVIGILIGFVGPNLMKFLGRGRKTSTMQTLRVVNGSINEFKMDTGRYPNELQDLQKKPEGISGWTGPYLPKKIKDGQPMDAWGQKIVYRLNPHGSDPAYQLYSLGDPDKEDDRVDLD